MTVGDVRVSIQVPQMFPCMMKWSPQIVLFFFFFIFNSTNFGTRIELLNNLKRFTHGCLSSFCSSEM